MPNIFAAYQSRLRIFFFQGSIYFLLFTIFLTTVRIVTVGDWQSIAKVITYAVVVLIMMRCLHILRKETMLAWPEDTGPLRLGLPRKIHNTAVGRRSPLLTAVPDMTPRMVRTQRLGVIVLLLTSAIYIAITPHALFVVGVIMLATILFFSVMSAEQEQAREWLGLAITLFLVALTFRQLITPLRIEYSFDLLVTLYLFPPFFFWLCVKIATNLLSHLAELLEVGQTLEADLRQSELQYQELLQTMNEGFVVVDEHEQFVYVNDKFCEMVGYGQDELIGQCNDTILRYDDKSLQTLRQQTAMRNDLQRSTYELSLLRKDDSPIHLLVSAVPRLEEKAVVGSFSVVMDITERKQVEEILRSERAQLSARVEERTASLRVAEEEYRALFDNVPIGLYRSSLAGRQLRANPTLVALNGYESEEAMLAAVTDIAAEWYVDPSRRAEFQKKLAAHGVVRNFESEIYRHKTRERIWVSETAILVNDDEGQPLYYQGTVQDISERRATEEARERLIAQLAKVARLKDEFLASMSHELRTPLNSILGMTEAMQDEIYGALNDRQRKALHTVESSGRHLLALINDILDLAKIESGQVELVIDTVDVQALCDATLRLIQPNAEKKSIDVTFHHQPDVKILMADGRRLKQMILNLLSNAIKFTPVGGHIGLEVSGNSQPEPVVTVHVWDTGVGIPEAAREHLFEPFVQVDSSLSRRYEGSGLGLALVKRMAELHHGTVEVESKVGEGSHFVITMPWHLPENTTATPSQHNGHSTAGLHTHYIENPIPSHIPNP